MLQRNKDHNKIAFLGEKLYDVKDPEVQPEPKKPTEKKIASDVQYADNTRGLHSRSGEKSILSTGGGGVSDFGGPKKHMGSQTGNSIWDPDQLSRLFHTEDNGEKIKKELQDSSNKKEAVKENDIKTLAEELKEVDLRKANSVANVGELSGGSYKAPANSISIFDKGDFERVPEKTAGEKVVEEARKAKTKDDSWKTPSNRRSSKSIFDNLFEKLSTNEEDSTTK